MIPQSELFNSPVEVGTRVALLLTLIPGTELNLDEIAFFDYVLIFSKEFDGGENIHPALPNHFSEIIKRKETLSTTLKLFISKGIITSSIGSDGIKYRATNNAIHYVSALKSSYYKRLIKNLTWVERNLSRLRQEQQKMFKIRVLGR